MLAFAGWIAAHARQAAALQMLGLIRRLCQLAQEELELGDRTISVTTALNARSCIFVCNIRSAPFRALAEGLRAIRTAQAMRLGTVLNTPRQTAHGASL